MAWTDTVKDISGGFLNFGIILIVVIIISALIVTIWLYIRKRKRFKQYRCIIISKIGLNQNSIEFDDAGIFVDSKTNNKRLFLKKNKVGLAPDNIPFIPTIKGQKIIVLRKTGLKNFQYVHLRFDGTFNIEVGEEDVNWSINAYEHAKKTFSQNTFMQALPYIALAFVALIILLIFVFFFKEFATLKDASFAFREGASALKDASYQILAGRNGTVILPP